MKRVLNSGSIKLPYIKGTEKDVLSTLPVDVVCRTFQEYLFKMEFKFEIKAPLLTFLAFQEAHLGTLTRLEEQDHLIAYLPPQFYKKASSMYNLLDPKSCNTYNTKFYNFYSAAVNFYNNLIRDGMCKEQAELVLPQGMLINFLWKITAKDLIKFIEDQHNKSPEMYGYCSTLVLYLEEHLPLCTKWLKTNRWQNYSL